MYYIYCIILYYIYCTTYTVHILYIYCTTYTVHILYYIYCTYTVHTLYYTHSPGVEGIEVAPVHEEGPEGHGLGGALTHLGLIVMPV
jgi:hypothetical protein